MPDLTVTGILLVGVAIIESLVTYVFIVVVEGLLAFCSYSLLPAEMLPLEGQLRRSHFYFKETN